VPFVADDLAAWLIGLLADAGRKKLTVFIRGTDQERALRSVAGTAIERTALELVPAGGASVEDFARVVSQVFGEPVSSAVPAGQTTLLEALQAAVADRLAVLGDTEITGTERSSAELLGVAVPVLTETLTRRLVQEIISQGAKGGPLEPLAAQLNHDRTYLQGQQLVGKVGDLVAVVQDALNRLDDAQRAALQASPPSVAGRPLAEVTDPFALEVHQPVQPEDPQPGLPALPRYVPREHDTELGSVVRAAAEGSSGIAVLVGGSSTGKTRACWEALRLLRDQEPGWRLWHPIYPSRADAALRELPAIGPRTVVWLNEAQLYLDVPDGLGERVAAGLRELLRDPARSPVLVLATLWPDFWDGLTARPAGGADPHAQARELLASRDITVPAAFTAAQLQRLSQAGDVRLAQAVGAQDGQVIQFLAGVPELLARYRNAQPAPTALIHAAMDAYRMGVRSALPRAFLEAAAPGYLTDFDWDQLPEDWLEKALAYTSAPSKGIRGPLTRIRPRNPGPDHAGGAAGTGQDETSLYRLADYLDQYGRRHRHALIPPPRFWTAALYAQPADLTTLAAAARARGLYRAAAQLLKSSAARGDPRAAANLIDILHDLHPGDHRPAQWATVDTALDLGDPARVTSLLDSLQKTDAQDQVAALLARDPATHVSVDDPEAIVTLLGSLWEAGAQQQVTVLADRAAKHAALGDPAGVASLLDSLREAGAQDQATALLARDPAAHVDLSVPGRIALLLDSLREAGERGQVTALLARDPAAHVELGNPAGVASLLDSLREAGSQDQATALLARDRAERAAKHAAVPAGVASLLDSPREAGEQDQATALAQRAARTFDNPGRLAILLDSLREAGEQDLLTTLLASGPAAHITLGNPRRVPGLLDSLRATGEQEQVTALVERAAHITSGNIWTTFGNFFFLRIPRLLDSLRKADAQDQVTALADRLPGEGLFHLFYSQGNHQALYRFGRNPDGSPARPWGWEDLN
jgi:uncharacterized protein YidB (DUF937 family)